MVFIRNDINRLICVHFASRITGPAHVTWATSQEVDAFLKPLPLGFDSDLHIKALLFPPVTHLSEGGIQLDCRRKLIQYRPGNASHLTDGCAGVGQLLEESVLQEKGPGCCGSVRYGSVRCWLGSGVQGKTPLPVTELTGLWGGEKDA